MKRIGILSDTHGRLSFAALGSLVDCDLIVHAGDIGGPGILQELAAYAPVVAVLGNNDYQEYGSSVGAVARFEEEGVAFLVAHRPRDAYRAAAQDPAPPQVLVHGHVHYPVLLAEEEAGGAQVVICPGSVSCPRMGSEASVAFVEVEAGFVTEAWVESLDGSRVM